MQIDPRSTRPKWTLSIEVRKPFGSDTVIAITSDQRLEPLEGALRKLGKLRKAGEIPRLIKELMPKAPAARLGFVNIFTDQ